MRISTWFGPAEGTLRSVICSTARFASVLLVGGTLLAGTAPAQDDDGPRRGRGDRPAERPGNRIPGAPPLVAALDTNRDGRLDRDEIDRASAALRSLDRDEDGELTRD